MAGKMKLKALLAFKFILCISTSIAPTAMAEVINVPCISSQASKGGWWYPTVKKEYFPLVLIKAQVWTRGIESHPLYSPKMLESKSLTKLASCAIVPANKEAWAQENSSNSQEDSE